MIGWMLAGLVESIVLVAAGLGWLRAVALTLSAVTS